MHIMSRGPRPEKAIAEAKGIAVERGAVVGLTPGPGLPVDFAIFGADRIIFVLVKRTRRHLSDTGEIGHDFAVELREIQRMPACPVASAELWVVAPWGTFQYFRVVPGPVTEICRPGLPVERPGSGPGAG